MLLPHSRGLLPAHRVVDDHLPEVPPDAELGKGRAGGGGCGGERRGVGGKGARPPGVGCWKQEEVRELAISTRSWQQED